MSLRHKPDVSNDELYMFRCLISMAHSDHAFEAPEKAFIEKILDGNSFSDEQRQILVNDMSNPQPVEELLPQITQPVNRAQVVHFARVMAYRDGELEPQEDTILAKLHGSAMKKVDLDKARQDVQNEIREQMEIHDKKMDEIKLPAWFEKVMNSFGFGL